MRSGRATAVCFSAEMLPFRPGSLPIFLLVFMVLEPLLFPCCKNAFMLGETFPAQPPTHAFCANIDWGELKEAVAQALVPSLIGPVKEECKNVVAEKAVEPAWQKRVHPHHEGDECMYAKHDTKHARTDDAHELEVHLADQRTSVGSWCKSAEYADFPANLGPLFLGKGHERLCCALTVCDQSEGAEAGLKQHTGDECRQVPLRPFAEYSKPTCVDPSARACCGVDENHTDCFPSKHRSRIWRGRRPDCRHHWCRRHPQTVAGHGSGARGIVFRDNVQKAYQCCTIAGRMASL